MAVVLELLREGIGQAGKAAYTLSEIEVLAFYEARRDVLRIRIPTENTRANADALGRTVARIRLV